MVAIFTGAGFGFERGSASVLGGIGLLGGAAQGRGGEGIYVNGATGNLLLQKQDEFLVGKGPDVGISRTYNSLTTLADDNNDKWRQSTDRRVTLTGTVNTVGSTVKRVSGDGTETTYAWDATRSAYLSKDGAGAYDVITYDAGTTEWVWTDGDSQTRERYYNWAAADGRAGLIKTATDINGLTVTFSYEAGSARLSRATTSDGAYTQYSWNANNSITQVLTGYTDLSTSTAKTLTRTRYGYESYIEASVTKWRLKTVTTDLTPGDNAIADGATYVTTYGYDASNRLNSVTQSDGSSLTVTFDGSNRVATLVQTASSGVTRTTTMTYYAGYTTVTDPSGQLTRMDYDAAGNLTKITAPPAFSGAAQQIVQFGYNANGDLTSTTDARGQITGYGNFTANGLAQTITDRTSAVTTRAYDSGNRLISESTNGIDASGSAVSQTVRYVYNTAGNLRFAISAEGRVTEYVRNGDGMVTAQIGYAEAAYTTAGTPTEANMTTWVSSLGNRPWVERIDYQYDARLGLVKQTSYGQADNAGAGVTADGVIETNYVYDQAGKLLSTYATGGAVASYVYDGMGRITASTDLNGGTTTIVFNDAATTTTITTSRSYTRVETYNKAGDLIQTTDSGAEVATGTFNYSYDTLGRVRVSEVGGVKTYLLYDTAGRHVADINAAGYITEYRFDANNRLIGTIYYRDAISAANLTSLANPNNTLTIAGIRPAGTTDDQSSWTVYDNEGRVIETILGDGSATIYSYDASGRLQKASSYYNKVTTSGFPTTPPTALVVPSAHASDSALRYFYDKDGLLVGTLDAANFVTQNTYDKAGHLVATTTFANATTAASPGTAGFTALLAGVTTSTRDRTTRNVYDGSGLLRYTIDAQAQVTRYDYNAAGLKVRTSNFATTLPATADYSYDNIKSLTFAPNMDNYRRDSYRVLDSAGRVAYSVDQVEGGDSRQALVTGYIYDSRGNVIRTVAYATSITATYVFPKSGIDSWAAGEAGNANNRVTRMYYNARDELSYIVDAEGYLTRRTYDGKGRMVGEQVVLTKPTVSDATTYVQIAAASTVGTTYWRTWAYDSLGRLTTETQFNGNYTSYAYFGTTSLVVQTTRGDGSSDQSVYKQTYDAAGREKTTVDGFGATEAVTTSKTYDGKGELISFVDARSNTTAYTYDLNGRLKTTTNALSGVTTYDYNAFGDAWKITDARGNSTYRWFDALGRVTAERDAENYLTTTTYSIYGYVASIKRWATPVTGTPAMATPPIGSGTVATTSFTYNRLGQLLTSTDALNKVESHAYNVFGDRISTTNRLNAITTYTFDKLSRITRESVNASTMNVGVNSAFSSNQIIKDYTYNPRGDRIRMVEGFTTSGGAVVNAMRTTDYDRDSVGRIYQTRHDSVTVIADDLTTTSTVTPTELYTYDRRDNVTKVVDANGAQTFNFYDKLDRKIVEIRQLSSTTTVYTRYDYDANGNLTSTKVYESGSIALPSTPGGTPPAPPSGLYRQTDYDYDALNRMTASKVISNTGNTILNGTWNGSAYVQTTDTLVTQYLYDGNGNVYKTIDPNGSETWSWYDKLNRKTHQRDGEGHVTQWTYDAEGNVLSETRYTTKQAGLPSASAPPSIGSLATDRITVYTYDLAGNRLSEKRTGVLAWNVDASTGALSAAGTDSIIVYTYNALGQVLTKTVANNLIATYAYDNIGRLESEQRAVYNDANGTNVTPTTTYAYNALGDLSRQDVAGGSGTYSAAARSTIYRYGEGGRLLAVTDAMGNWTNYSYDAVGRQKKEAFSRIVNADDTSGTSGTTTVSEARGTLYDLGGRAIRTSVYSSLGGTYKLVDYANFKFNVFDQVIEQGSGDNSATGFNPGTATALYQSRNIYDAAGRMVATNSGDGVWKFFSYDKAGNQTGAITSAGGNFTATQTFAERLVYIGNSDMNGTYTVYDRRNQATQVIEEGRGRSASVTGETITTGRTYNAFGEVATETNAQGSTITYTYNTMGRMIRWESPMVRIKGENGGDNWIRPSEDYYYDLAGRRVASRDANGSYSAGSSGSPASKGANTGNLTTFALLAGTGYDGGQALISTEFHNDGGKKQTLYDIMGDARVLRSEIFDYANAATTTQFFEEQFFNQLGQLTQVKHKRVTAGSGDANRLVDNYAYDQFGQRIQHWNSQYGAASLDKTTYDALGRVVSQTDMENHRTMTSYTWKGTLATGGMGTFGGWEEVTTYSDTTRTSTVRTDLFGREVYKSDLGTHVFTSSFDFAGRLVGRTTGATTQTWQWYNTGLLKQSSGPNGTEDYSYDQTGNRLTEKLVSGGETIKDATATYDALGRLATFVQASSTFANGGPSPYTTPEVSNEYYYDAVGNIRQTLSTHRMLDHQGVVSGSTVTDNFWFRYDSMNRLVVDKGTLSGAAGAGGTQIVRGIFNAGALTYGQNIEYDLAGQRKHVIRTMHVDAFYEYPIFEDEYLRESRDNYEYYGDGTLGGIRVTMGAKAYYTFNGTTGTWDPPSSLPAAQVGGGPLFTYLTYDFMGRQTGQVDANISGTTTYSRTSVYNKIGQLTSETTATLKGTTTSYTVTSTSNYSYTSGSEYLLGAVSLSTGTEGVSGGSTKNTQTTNTYDWFDGAVQSTIAYKPDTSSGTTYNTSFYYDAVGQLYQVYITDGRPRNVYFKTDGAGQIVRRDEVDGNSTNGDPHEAWYRFNGRELGYLGNNGTSDLKADIAATDRLPVAATGGAFRNGQLGGASYADFAGSYDPLNSYGQGSSAGSYTVQQSGESLRSIAQALWGDSALWYKLADANGLQVDTTLIEGQRLAVPVGVVRSSHNASTLKPYNADEAIGNLSPTTPKPAKKNKCGVFGQILLAAVAIAVTALALPSGGASITIGQGALAGLAGGAASQAVGVATGIQSKFDFKGLALSALGGAVGAGMADISKISASAGKFLNGGSFAGNVASGALRSALTQGIGVATGLQNKFSWAGVAAAGVGAGVGGVLGKELGIKPLYGADSSQSLGNIAGNAFVGTASAIASAATRSALTGTSFGDNLMRALPDAIGQTVGGLVAGKIAGGRVAGDDQLTLNTGTTGGDLDVIVNKDLIRNAGAGLLESSSAALIYGDAQTASLFGADSGTVARLGRRDALASQALAGLLGTASGNGFQSELVRGSYSGTPAQAISYFEMRQKEAYFADVVSKAGSNPSSAEQADFTDMRSRLGAERATLDKAYAIADRNVVDMMASVNGTVDFGKGLYRLANGEVNWENGLSVGFGLAGAFGGLKVFGRAAEGASLRGLGASPYATNGDLVQSIATRADNWGIRNGLGNGPVAGTLKHGYADEVLTRYQRMFGDRGLTTEARYVGGEPWEPGMTTTGSIRLDVVDGPLDSPTRVWDYKFGQATLSSSRITQIQNGIPNGANVPVLMVKP